MNNSYRTNEKLECGARMLYSSSLISAKKQPTETEISLFIRFIIALQDEEIYGSFDIHFNYLLDSSWH